MLVWGGSRYNNKTFRSIRVRDGAAYNPNTDSWRTIPDAPIVGGYWYSIVWTGTEMIVWGDPRRRGHSRGNVGAAFDPSSNEWRHIADGPLTGRSGHLAVWTGDEMIVWGGYLTAYNRERYDGEGAAYDPATDTWRMLPRAPLPAGYDAMGAWTGNEVLVMATPMGNKASDYPKFAEAAAYDPASDSWRELPRPPHVAYVSPPAVFFENELILLSLGGEVDGGEVNNYGRSYDTGGILDVSEEEWREHADTSLYANQRWEQIALDEEVVIDGLAYDPDEDSWRKLPKFPLGNREFPVRVWTGTELIIWGGAKLATGNVHVDPPPPRNTGAAYTPPP
jgi:N-acetylneuraminic acid mutarotase